MFISTRMSTCTWCGTETSNRRFCSIKCNVTHRHRSVPIEERFWSFVEKKGSCWEWTGGRDWDGYGIFSVRGKSVRAHRMAYSLAHGEEMPSVMVLHRCDNPPCCNPEHLWIGTALDNARDAVSKGRTATGDRSGARLYPERLRRGPMPPRAPETRPRGSKHANAKLTEDKVIEIFRRIRLGDVQRAIAREYCVSTSTVSLLLQRKIWAHVTLDHGSPPVAQPETGNPDEAMAASRLSR